MGKLVTSGPVSRRTLLGVLGAFAASTAVLAACQQAPAAPAPAAPPAATATPIPANVAQAQGSQAGIMRPTDGTPKKGGTFNLAFGVTTAHYDIHQGGSSSVLTHMYNNLIRFNLIDGLKTNIPDLATSWEVSPDGL